MIIIAVIISLSILIFIHELGHFLMAKLFRVKVEEFGIGFPPRVWSREIGGTRYSINLLPFGGFVKIFDESGSVLEKNGEKEKEEGSFANQPVWKRSAIILAGVAMNIFLGWIVLCGIFIVGAPEHLMVSGVAPESPAEVSGIKNGDVIMVARLGDRILNDPIKSDDFVSFVKEFQGQEIYLSLKRGGDLINAQIKGRVNPPAGQGSLGVNLSEIGFPSNSFLSGVINGSKATVNTLKLVAISFVQFFSKVFITPKIVESVSGPVGIMTIAVQAGSLGLIYLLQFMALISLNLVILNLLPFPALDGGRFIMLVLEKIKGTPISQKIQIGVNAFGFVLLVLLMIVVTAKDVAKLF
ncbi:MAG: M50 family metallopeptidase [Patescibacteria group bacterium]|nr:M50 family metallopeptidase [Patescibacteria group bacterium]